MLKCFCEDPMPLDSDNICATKCGHIFHDSCLLQWLSINSICPQCRTPITRREHFRLYPTLSDESDEQETVVQDTLKNLDRVQGELNQMTELCKRKDKTIEELGSGSGLTYKTIKEQHKRLKNVLQTFHGENLDVIFDDPELFASIVNGPNH